MANSNGREPDDEASLTDDHRSRIALLTPADISNIDDALLARCDHHWRKVAFVVGTAMQYQADRVLGIPDIFYSQRVRSLVDLGLLEATGDLAYMRYSEVRRAS